MSDRHSRWYPRLRLGRFLVYAKLDGWNFLYFGERNSYRKPALRCGPLYIGMVRL